MRRRERVRRMRIVDGAEEARRTILRRRLTSDAELSPAGLARTAAVMGETMSAAEAVKRIIADVRREGDAAVRHYSEAFDGVPHRDLEVPLGDIEAALGAIEPEV